MGRFFFQLGWDLGNGPFLDLAFYNFMDLVFGIRFGMNTSLKCLIFYFMQGTVIRKKNELHKVAEANRAFAHFRWW